jgi:hypothetical protein
VVERARGGGEGGWWWRGRILEIIMIQASRRMKVPIDKLSS